MKNNQIEIGQVINGGLVTHANGECLWDRLGLTGPRKPHKGGKNNKRSPLTIARQAAFCADLGIEPGQTLKNALAGELNALATLSSELIGAEKMTVELTDDKGRAIGQRLTVDKPQARISMESTAQGNRDNHAPGEVNYKKKIHPRTGVEYGEDERGEASACVVHRPGASADCELEETDRALLATTTHAGTNDDNDDKPEIETL